jgi:hypothetical protein
MNLKQLVVLNKLNFQLTSGDILNIRLRLWFIGSRRTRRTSRRVENRSVDRQWLPDLSVLRSCTKFHHSLLLKP